MFEFLTEILGGESRGFGSDKIRHAGDINVEQIKITSLKSGKSFNVTNQLLTIQIYEDMFAPFISGSLIFRESLDFITNFPFIGEEVVDLRIFTPGYDINQRADVINARFYIYKISDREKLADRNMVYQLHFVSVEAVTDLNTKISKAFEGNIREIVPSIVDTWLQGPTQDFKKKMLCTLVANKTKYVSNFWSPVKNLNYLAERALDALGNPTYIFFENRYGFNFISLDELNFKNPIAGFINNQVQDNVKEGGSDGGGSSKDLNSQYKTIRDFQVISSQNYMDNVMGGAYGSSIMFFDITKKKYKRLSYKAPSKFGPFEKHLNLSPLYTSKLLATNKGVLFNDVVHSKMFGDQWDDVTSVTMRLERMSRLKLAEAFKINIVVAGKTNYTVGQKVRIKSYKSAPVREQDGDDENVDYTISGFYLIATINHVIDRKSHECHMQLIKDSYHGITN
jgi:hypothetical protein